MEKYRKILCQDGDRFKSLANEMLVALTPEAFYNSYTQLVAFASNSTHCNKLSNWVCWWVEKKEIIFRTFCGYSAPRMKQVIHAGWVQRDKIGVSLLDACYFDVRDSLVLESEIYQFNFGSFPGSSGPSAAEEVNAAEQYGREILDFGVNQPGDAMGILCFSHLLTKAKEKQMFLTRMQRANEQKDSMKIQRHYSDNALKKSYSVVSSKALKVSYQVEISNSPLCTCSDFLKNGRTCNYIHMFILQFVLKCNNRFIVPRQQCWQTISRSTSQDIPDHLYQTIKAKRRKLAQGNKDIEWQNAEVVICLASRHVLRFVML